MGRTPTHSTHPSLPRLKPNTLSIHIPRKGLDLLFDDRFWPSGTTLAVPVRFPLTYLTLFHFSTIQ